MPFIPPYISSLTPYEPGKSILELKAITKTKKIIKLASNENPFGPSPKAKAAIQKALKDLHYYPDGGLRLKEKLAQKHQVSTKNIILGGGSDSLVLSIVRAFVTEGGEVVTSDFSFPQYFLFSKSRGAIVKLAPFKNYTYDLEAIQKCVTHKTQIIFLANPNNPTGTIFTRKEWEKFYQNIDPNILIVLDEAYAEFAEANKDWPNSLKDRLDNVITLRTFSKAYGLAGVRLGYAVAHEKWIDILHKVKLPFEPSSLAIAAGEGALQDSAFVKKYLTTVEKERLKITKCLTEMGISVPLSSANFVMMPFETEQDAKDIFEGLLREGIIVRWLHPFHLPNALRISIGRPEENKRCLETIRMLLEKTKHFANHGPTKSPSIIQSLPNT